MKTSEKPVTITMKRYDYETIRRLNSDHMSALSRDRDRLDRIIRQAIRFMERGSIQTARDRLKDAVRR